MNDYICPVCAQPLEAVSYFSKAVKKTKLWCSDAAARLEADHKAVVYYPSKNGEFWSFGLKAKPIPNGTAATIAPVVKTKRSRRKFQKRRNRQRQLSL